MMDGLDHVPSYRCSRCGEKLTAATPKRLQARYSEHMIDKHDKPAVGRRARTRATRA